MEQQEPAASAAFDERRGWVVEATGYEAIVAENAHDEHALTARFSVR